MVKRFNSNDHPEKYKFASYKPVFVIWGLAWIMFLVLIALKIII